MTVKIVAAFETRAEADDFSKSIEESFPADRFGTALAIRIGESPFDEAPAFVVEGSREEKPK